MPAPVFSWFPDANVSLEMQPRVSAARFGDGYEQRVANGINTQMEQWTLSFTGGREEIDAIDAFLRARNGVEAFEWMTPDEQTGLFICRSWTKRRERGVKVTLSAKFEQVPA